MNIPEWSLILSGRDLHRAVFLKQVVFWSTKTTDSDGFYRSLALWKKDCLSRRKVRSATQWLISEGVLEVVTKHAVGSKFPSPQNHYKLDSEALLEWAGEELEETDLSALRKALAQSVQTDTLTSTNVPINKYKRTGQHVQTDVSIGTNVQNYNIDIQTDKTDKEIHTEKADEEGAQAPSDPTPLPHLQDGNEPEDEIWTEALEAFKQFYVATKNQDSPLAKELVLKDTGQGKALEGFSADQIQRWGLWFDTRLDSRAEKLMKPSSAVTIRKSLLAWLRSGEPGPQQQPVKEKKGLPDRFKNLGQRRVLSGGTA